MDGTFGFVTRVALSSDWGMGEDDTSVTGGLRRGDVRREGEGLTGWVSIPGRIVSKERRVADVVWVSCGVRSRLCSG